VDAPVPSAAGTSSSEQAFSPSSAPLRCVSPSSPARPVRHLGWVRRVELLVWGQIPCQTTPRSLGSTCAGEAAVERRSLLRRSHRSRLILILRSRSILAAGSIGNIPVKPSVRCAFAFKPLGFSISKVYPSTIEEPLQIGPDLYGFNPSFSRICVRSPALEVLCYRPCVYKHNSVLAPEFLQLGPCKPSFPAE
jgi:hypothetical protein